jgi:erythromycin esterase-like protein
MKGSIAAVLEYLDEVDPEAATVARERYGCLTPWQKEPSTYGRAVITADAKMPLRFVPPYFNLR